MYYKNDSITKINIIKLYNINNTILIKINEILLLLKK